LWVTRGVVVYYKKKSELISKLGSEESGSYKEERIVWMEDTDRNCLDEGEGLKSPTFFFSLLTEVCLPISKASTACEAHGQDVLP